MDILQRTLVPRLANSMFIEHLDEKKSGQRVVINLLLISVDIQGFSLDFGQKNHVK